MRCEGGARVVVMAWGDIMKGTKQMIVGEEWVTRERWHKGR